MNKQKLAITLCASVVLCVGCSAKSSYYANKSEYKQSRAQSNSEYVIVVDYEKIAKVNRAAYLSAGNNSTIWVNLPTKRVKRSELENLPQP